MTNHFAIVVYDALHANRKAVYSSEAPKGGTVNITIAIDGSNVPVPATLAPVQSFTYRMDLTQAYSYSGVIMSSCKDALLQADSYDVQLDIDPFDIVEIQLKSGSSYARRYVGKAIIPSYRRTDGKPRTYRLIGMTDDLEVSDCGINAEYAEGQNLGAVVADVVSKATRHAALRVGPISIPGVTTTARINPSSVSLAEFFRAVVALAASAGVDVVWGVDEWRRIFVQPKAAVSASYSENDLVANNEGWVEWREPANVGHINRVRWYLADGVKWEEPTYTPDLLTHESRHGDESLGVRYAHLETDVTQLLKHLSLDWVVYNGVARYSYVGSAVDDPTLGNVDFSRMFDGNPASYAEMGLDAVDGGNRYRMQATAPAGLNFSDVAAVRVAVKLAPPSGDNYYVTAAVGFSLTSFGVGLSYQIDLLTGTFGSTVDALVQGRATDLDVDATYYLGDRLHLHRPGTVDRVFLNIFSPGALIIGVSEIQFYTLDKTALDAMALQEYKFPVKNPFALALVGYAPAVTAINLAAVEGDVITLPTTEAEYRLDGMGLVSRLITGEPAPAEAVEEAEIERRIRNRQQVATVKSAVRK